MLRRLASLLVVAFCAAQWVRGTLVVAVPTADGLVVCSDKRLFNVDAGTFTDTNVKINRAGNNALFVATNTVGIWDSRTRSIAFDANAVVAEYVKAHEFKSEPQYWQGLKKAITEKLREYFKTHDYAAWPETDKANNNLLFNLFFYSGSAGQPLSHTIKVSYKKARTPSIDVSGPVTDAIKLPKLSGKGREIMGYISMDRAFANDPSILRFDERIFNPRTTKVIDAVDFSAKLFRLTSSTMPAAHVSPTFDCALLNYQTGFQWIEIKPASSRLSGLAGFQRNFHS